MGTMTSFGKIGARRTVRILPYDAEVEYLESTGTQWIDTGVIAGKNTECAFGACRNKTGNDNPVFASDAGSWSYAAYSFVFHNYSTRFVFGNKFVDAPVMSVGQWIDVECSSNQFVVNKNSYGAPAQQGEFSPSVTLPLFAWRRGGNIIINGYVLISYFRIADNGRVVRDFIPVRFTNEFGVSEGAMYDRANPTVGMNPDGSARTDGLYRNRGTGAFLYGNDI